MDIDTAGQSEIASIGLDFWMTRVNEECDHVRGGFEPEPVHDLRVALRRCRSIADGFMAFDPHPAWKQMKSESKKIFQELGSLRDTQVMAEWVQRLASPLDEAAIILSNHLVTREIQLRKSASASLQDFNQKKWSSWTRLLSRRARRISLEGAAFQHLALERWLAARELHHQALRNRSHASYHRLRIGLKKFRYIIENFLPSRDETWGPDLRELQDLLGEMHDLHVLWRTALTIGAFRSDGVRLQWKKRIEEESNQRLEGYRQKMLGDSSLWQIWRSELPEAEQIRNAALARLRAWASFRDPDFSHSENVAKLAMQIYDGLDSLGLMPKALLPDARFMLESAAVAHDVGLHAARKKHQLASYRMIRKLNPSPGWTAETLRIVASIARFHRRALPRIDQKAFSGMPADQRRAIVLLSGILRLADALDYPHQRRVRQLVLKRTGEVIRICVQEYSEYDASAEMLAAARHLLETACRLPIVIQRL